MRRTDTPPETCRRSRLYCHLSHFHVLPGQQHSRPVGPGGRAGVCSLSRVRLLFNVCDSGARACRLSSPDVLQTARSWLFLPASPLPTSRGRLAFTRIRCVLMTARFSDWISALR